MRERACVRAVVWQPTLSKALSGTTPEGRLYSPLLFPWYTETFKYVNFVAAEKMLRYVNICCFHLLSLIYLDPTRKYRHDP